MNGTKFAQLLMQINSSHEPQYFENYQTENFFDEMFGNSNDSNISEFYKPIYDRITDLTESEFEQRESKRIHHF